MRNLKRSPGLRRRPAALNSFSLVEVVIAIAVISFVLVSVLGLMAYATQLVQQADTYSRLSNVASQVLAKFNSQPFSVSSNAAYLNSSYFYSYEGLPTNAAGAYYQCNVTNANPTPQVNLMQVQLSIRWPMTNAGRLIFPNTNVIITSTLNYN